MQFLLFIWQLKQSSYIFNGAKVSRSTSAYALPLFLPHPKNQGKNNLSKVHSWEQPRNSFPCPVLTYHFFVPIGALENLCWIVQMQSLREFLSLQVFFDINCTIYILIVLGSYVYIGLYVVCTWNAAFPKMVENHPVYSRRDVKCQKIRSHRATAMTKQFELCFDNFFSVPTANSY